MHVRQVRTAGKLANDEVGSALLSATVTAMARSEKRQAVAAAGVTHSRSFVSSTHQAAPPKGSQKFGSLGAKAVSLSMSASPTHAMPSKAPPPKAASAKALQPADAPFAVGDVPLRAVAAADAAAADGPRAESMSVTGGEDAMATAILALQRENEALRQQVVASGQVPFNSVSGQAPFASLSSPSAISSMSDGEPPTIASARFSVHQTSGVI